MQFIHLLLWVALGASIGLVGSLVEERNHTKATFIINGCVGAVGAVFGGLLLLPVVTPYAVVTSMASMMTVLVAAVVLLALVNLCRNSGGRRRK